MPIFAIKDKKGSFGAPFVANNSYVAERGFAYQLVEGNDAMMKFSPMDFDLYKIGEFEVEKGIVTPTVPIELVRDGESAVLNYGKT